MNFYSLIESFFPADRTRILIETDSRTYSYADLHQITGRYASLFLELGLQPGDRVAAQVEKSPEALFLYLASLRAGLIYLPMNTAYQPAEVDHLIADAEPHLVVCDPKLSDRLRLSAERHGVSKILTLDDRGTGSFSERAQCLPVSFSTRDCPPDAIACLVYTSGTTGRPKGAMITHENLASNVRDLVAQWEFTEDDVLIHALPIFHVHGLFVASHCALLSGARMIWHSRFDPRKVIADFPRATVFMGVPTFYTRLLTCPELNSTICRSIRLFISGSAPLLEDTFRQFHKQTGATVLERYGMTETGMITSNPLQGERRPGTVGFALPSVSVRVAESDANLVGMIQVQGPNVFRGYWKMNQTNGTDFTSDGWFITGDLGKFDSDGYLRIVGRAKDLVITGGYNVYPKEVEAALDQLEGVAESAVFGVPHPDFGEAVTAAVKLSPGHTHLTEQEILQQLKTRIAGYKVPKTIQFVEELPRNVMGKVLKKGLREKFGETAPLISVCNQNLRDSLEIQNLLVQSSPLAICAYREDGQCVVANPAASRIIGTSVETLLSQNFRQIISWKESGLYALAEEALRVGIASRSCINLKTSFGRNLWISAHFASFFRNEKRHLLVMLQDISDWARADEALRSSEYEFRTWVETAREGLGAADQEHRITFVNQRFIEMFGYTPDELIGRPITEFVYEEDRENLLRQMTDRREGREGSYEIRYRHKSGQIVHALVSATPRFDRAGNFCGVTAIATDISELKKAQALRLQNLRDERLARAEAEKANAAKDAFLAILSHELRTPLTTILAWIQMLKLGRLPLEQQIRGIEMIEHSAILQGKLIDDLLDISRIVTGKISIEMTPTAPAEIVETITDSMKLTAAQKEITLHLELDHSANTIETDPARLRQVLSNILGNAIKFSPPQGIINVQLKYDRNYCLIEVRDQGVGIDPAFLPRLFDRFSQEEDPTTRTHGGLGLGLSISCHLIRLMGGLIEAESAGKNLGSKFTIKLPLYQAKNSDPSIKHGLLHPSISHERIQGLRILLVDDDASSMEALALILRTAGAYVDTVDSIALALSLIEANAPDLILTDLAMPKGSGYELIQAVRALPAEKGGKTVTIALTAHVFLEDRMRALAAGFDGYLSKPIEMNQLLDQIIKHANLRLKN